MDVIVGGESDAETGALGTMVGNTSVVLIWQADRNRQIIATHALNHLVDIVNL